MEYCGIDISVYEIKACTPIKSIRVMLNPPLIDKYWVKFKQGEIYEVIFIDNMLSVEVSEGIYVPFSVEDFEKWFKVLEDKA
jgi:hypothetical protein